MPFTKKVIKLIETAGETVPNPLAIGQTGAGVLFPIVGVNVRTGESAGCMVWTGWAGSISLRFPQPAARVSTSNVTRTQKLFLIKLPLHFGAPNGKR
jgi:hypothetical protein